MRSHLIRKVEQWEIYDRMSGHGIYADTDKKFLPTERYDWTLLTEIELFKNAVKGCKRVLDIGCGTGHPSLYLTKDVGSIIGIDKSEKMIEIAKNKLSRSGAVNTSFEVGDAENLRFRKGSFDAIILCGSLATFSDQEKALREIKRVLKMNGKITCIELNWLYRSTHERHFQGEGNFVLTQEDSITYRYVCRSTYPHKETDYRCIISPRSVLGKKLLSNSQFRKRKTLTTEMDIEQVKPFCDEIEYDEQVQFDPQTIARLFAENGFTDVNVEGYGIVYDLLTNADLVGEMASRMKEVCKAEINISRFLDPTKTEMLFLTCNPDSTTSNEKSQESKEL